VCVCVCATTPSINGEAQKRWCLVKKRTSKLLTYVAPPCLVRFLPVDNPFTLLLSVTYPAYAGKRDVRRHQKKKKAADNATDK
jgi:hypothetical protein